VLRQIFSLFSSDLAVDLGTTNTLIYLPRKGIVVNEPSVVALREGKLVAVGHEAKQILGRAPHNITLISPLKEGVVANLTATEMMLRHLIQRVHQSRLFPPTPKLLLGIPHEATEVERRAFREAALGAEARQVYLVEEPVAAALGAGLPIEEAGGSMVLDIGGGTTELAILSYGGIVYAKSLQVAGCSFDRLIQSYVQRHHNLAISEQTAERVKIEIGSASPRERVEEIEVVGRDLKSGIPRTFLLNSNEIHEAILPALDEIALAIKEALQSVSPDVGADLIRRGVVLTGGGALLEGLDRFLSEEIGIPVQTAEEPLTCVARGIGRILEEWRSETYRNLLEALP